VDSSCIVEIHDLKFGYGNKEILALNGITLEIYAGEFVVLAGPSGCGKSTLCDVIAGLIPHSVRGRMSGSVTVFGKDIWDWSVQTLSQFVGLVKQNAEDQLITFTVRDEIAFGPENLGYSVQEIETKITSTAERIGITHLLDREVDQLSGGEKQRVVIASMLALDPQLLILDEPTAFLDIDGIDLLHQTLTRLRSDPLHPLTVLYVDHDIRKALPIAERFIIMDPSGTIYQDGPTREVLFQNHINLIELGIRIPALVQFMANVPSITAENLPLSLQEMYDLPFSAKHNFARLWKTAIVARATSTDYPEDEVPLIEFVNVNYEYPRAGKFALNNLNFKIYRGQFVGLMGSNGSGKTTLLYIISKVLDRYTGMVNYNGRDLREFRLKDIAAQIGFIFQNPETQLFKSQMREEICFGAQNFGMHTAEIDEQFQNLIHLFNLQQENPRTNPFLLSWGQKRRVNFASILIYSPDIILLDEPFVGQDQNNVNGIMEILKQLNLEGKTIILCSHNPGLMANYCDHIIQLDQGEMVKSGPPMTVLNDILERKLDILAEEWNNGAAP